MAKKNVKNENNNAVIMNDTLTDAEMKEMRKVFSTAPDRTTIQDAAKTDQQRKRFLEEFGEGNYSDAFGNTYDSMLQRDCKAAGMASATVNERIRRGCTWETATSHGTAAPLDAIFSLRGAGAPEFAPSMINAAGSMYLTSLAHDDCDFEEDYAAMRDRNRGYVNGYYQLCYSDERFTSLNDLLRHYHIHIQWAKYLLDLGYNINEIVYGALYNLEKAVTRTMRRNGVCPELFRLQNTIPGGVGGVNSRNSMTMVTPDGKNVAVFSAKEAIRKIVATPGGSTADIKIVLRKMVMECISFNEACLRIADDRKGASVGRKFGSGKADYCIPELGYTKDDSGEEYWATTLRSNDDGSLKPFRSFVQMCRDFYCTPEEIYVGVLELHKPLSAALTDGKEAVKKARKDTGYIRSVRIPKDLRKAMNN